MGENEEKTCSQNEGIKAAQLNLSQDTASNTHSIGSGKELQKEVSSQNNSN